MQCDSSIEWVPYWAGLAESYAFESSMPDMEFMGMPSRRLIRREPVGVVGAITPWNFPLYLNLCKLGPALAAGCTVVLKPAPDTPWSATTIGRVIVEHTDIPPGIVNIVAGSDHALGEPRSLRRAKERRSQRPIDRLADARLLGGQRDLPAGQRETVTTGDSAGAEQVSNHQLRKIGCGNTQHALADLFAREPALKVHVLDEAGALRPHVLCFVDDRNTRWGEACPLREGSRITILQAVSGG